MKPTAAFRLFAIVLGLAFGGPLRAQASGNDIAEFIRITPKPGHEAMLIQAVTEYHHWVANFEGHREYVWYEVLTGPNTGSYVARSGGHNWSDFDARHDWQDKADEVFRTNVAPHIERVERFMTQEMPDLTFLPENRQSFTHYQLESWYVVNGQNGKFRRGLKRIVDTLKANNFVTHFSFVSVLSGGTGDELMFVRPNKGWADMVEDNPTFQDIMTREFGGVEAFEAFMADWGSTFRIGPSGMLEKMPGASEYKKN